MRDTIYRDEAVEICERWRQRAKEHYDRNGWYMADILLRFMKEMPSADRPQGEAPLEHGYMWTCPKCELEVHSDFDTCPRCGYEREDRPQEWIPCSERMPMYDVDVLVYRPTMGMKIIVDHYYGYYGEDIDTLDEWYEGWAISRENPVTAWMPLPEPWKGADDE